MHFNREVSVGHLLTVASVLIALASLLYSQWRDRIQVRFAEQAAIREAAGIALAELDRISNETEIFFLQVEPEYVTVSEALAEHRDRIKARDELWRFITEKRADMEQAIARTSGFSGAQAIAQADPKLFADFQSGLRTLGELRLEAFANLVDATQRQVLALEPELENYTSAQLGNAFRLAHHRALVDYRAKKDAVIEPLRRRLEVVLGATSASSQDAIDGGCRALAAANADRCYNVAAAVA